MSTNINYRLKMPIKGVVIGDTYGDGTSSGLAQRIIRCRQIGCNAVEFVPVVQVGTTGAKFTYDVSDGYIKTLTASCKTAGLQPSMLTPHINTGDANLHRDPNIIGIESTFFSNMKTMLLHYAQVAFNNGYEYLCLLSESYKIENQQYATYWQGIVNAIRKQNPTLKLAVTSVSSNSCLYPLVDIIGFNYYGGLNTRVSWANYSTYVIEDDNTLKKGVNNILQQINTMYKTYSKPCFFGEMGDWGGTPGTGYSSDILYPPNHNAWKPSLQALWYKDTLPIITQIDPAQFLGGYIWSITDWDQNNDHYSPLYNPAEAYIEQYYKNS